VKDREDRIVAIFAGHPEGDSWADTIRSAIEAIEEFASTPNSLEGGEERRGAFRTLSAGVSYGGGQPEPMVLGQTKFLAPLLKHPALIRIANFGSAIFATYAPKLYVYYAASLGKLFEYMPYLTQPFPGSIFTATSVNFGPDTVTWCHVDGGNVPFGLCAITALGSFDYKKGGHVYLWELGLVIEFPSGGLALITSGSVHHGNTPIQAGETRYSFTQYVAGGLFRWAAYGFRT
ncbi:hypothetical protein BV25DRAFT_1767757, partial [Artomyces pyxidatus]